MSGRVRDVALAVVAAWALSLCYTTLSHGQDWTYRALLALGIGNLWFDISVSIYRDRIATPADLGKE